MQLESRLPKIQRQNRTRHTQLFLFIINVSDLIYSISIISKLILYLLEIPKFYLLQKRNYIPVENSKKLLKKKINRGILPCIKIPCQTTKLRIYKTHY